MLLPKLAIKNAQFTLTIVVLLVLVGIVSYFEMPRSEDPQFDMPITLIEVIYPGASPTDIETLVVNPLEAEFSDIENIKKIESQVKNGGARIEITFLYGVDSEASYNKVKQAVSSVKPTLPEGVQDLLVLKATPTSVAIMQLALWSEPIDYKLMEFHAKQLEKRLEAINDVRKANVWGYPQQIVAVDVNLALLKHYGLSVTDINTILQRRAINITPGFVNATSRRFNVKASGNYVKLKTLGETVIRSDDSFILRLKDVATIEFSGLEPNYLAYYDDNPVIFLTIEQRPHTNIFDLTESIENEIASFNKSLPDNVKVDVLFKQSDSVESRVNGFFDNLWQGLLLVGIMSLIFLGFRESLVVILVIPLSFLVAIGWLDFIGFGLQQMSIVGLIIALGLLVDNAIVVTESIHREKKKVPSLTDAAASGTSKVGWAITSGTVTTMLAFLPMLLLASSTGDFVRSMPVTVVLVLLSSLLIALTLTPLLASRFFAKETEKNTSKIKTLQHYVNIFAEQSYAKWLGRFMNSRWIVIIIAVICLAGMLSLFGKVGVSLFPKAEKPMLLLDVVTPPNSSLAYTDQVMQKMTKVIEKYDLVDKVALNIGSANPRIYYNKIPKRGVATYGQVVVVLKEYEEEKVSNLVVQLREEFNQWKKAKITVSEFTQGPVTDLPISVRLMGESLSDLERVANDLANMMARTEGIINIDNPIGIANTELLLDINYEKAGLTNIDINTIDITLQTILSGTSVGLFNDENGENYPIIVRRKNPDIDGLANINVTNRLGEAIPLNQFITTKLQKGQTQFYHYQKLRMAKVSADVDKKHTVSERTAKVIDYLNNYDMPNGVNYNLGGEEESRQENFSGLTQIMLVTAIGIFAVLVLQFKSFLQPLVIFTSIPFAIAGSVIGLYLTGQSFSMMAFIGLISLFGIVVNNAIILIDTANRNLKESSDLKQAIIDASASRFTPILLTTLTTIGGLLPLTIFGGALWQPLGIVIISGLCVSAIASFLLVPVLTEIFTKDNRQKNY
ncbi:MAG: efflux RND transporter permease subunit [Colwellia sp.]|nr:efflux RND transporter permease subunit [Colwellia sp.]